MGDVDLRPGVVIGKGTVINGPKDIVARLGVKISAHCQIAKNTWIADCDPHFHAVAGQQLKDTPREVIIGDCCWIGQNVTILEGVAVGEGSIAGARSLVTKNVEPGTMVAGVPARKIKEDVIWE